MKTSPEMCSIQAVKPGFFSSTPLLSIRLFWMLLIAVFVLPAAVHAQIIGFQDVFTYNTSNINGHAPTTGTGAWLANYVASGTISTSGSQAVIVTDGGLPGLGSQANASLAFTPSANTLYTLTTTVKFIGTTGSDCWVGFGFSNGTGGGGTAPWGLIRPQSAPGNNGGGAFCSGGSTWPWSGSISSSQYANPIVATITWNTATGVTQLSLNGTVQATGTGIVPSGGYYAFFKGYQTGNTANVVNTTLSAQTLSWSTLAMQDNFTYVSSNINGQAPTTVKGGAWGANWGVWASSGTISTTGSSAAISTNNGVPGAGNVIANFPIEVNPNSFYTLRIAHNFVSLTGTADCWTGMGIANASNNVGPWALIRPQSTPGANGSAALSTGTNWPWSGTVAAAKYSAPMTSVLTWNTSNGEIKYYINDILQCTSTSAVQYGAKYNAFFQGFQTGNAVNVNTVSLTAQKLPLPVVFYTPEDWQIVTYFNDIFESGTSACEWPTARSHTNVFCIYDKYFYSSLLTDAQRTQILTYLRANNIKLGICVNALAKSGTKDCTWAEGYDGMSAHQTAVNKIVALGGTVDYLTLDIPLGGSYQCSLPIATAAAQTGSTVNIFKSAFPNIQVVDLDGAQPMADITAWLQAYQAVVGKPMDHYQVDFNPHFAFIDSTGTSASNPNPGLTNIRAACQVGGVKFGIIYDGFPDIPGQSGTQANGPAVFALGTKINQQCFNNSSLAGVADSYQIASWGGYNVPCPETTGTTLSALVNMVTTSPYVMQMPSVAIYKLWYSGCYMTTSSEAEYLGWMAAGYQDMGSIGGIIANPATTDIRGLVPLYRYKKASGSGAGIACALSLSTNDPVLTGSNSSGNYAYESCQGYVFPLNTGYSLGGCGLYEYYLASANRYIYDSNSNRTDYIASGYVNNGVKCYVMPGWYHKYHGN